MTGTVDVYPGLTHLVDCFSVESDPGTLAPGHDDRCGTQ